MKPQRTSPTVDHLRALPVRNHRAAVQPQNDGAALVSIPVTYPRWAAPLAAALGLRRERSVELDGVGFALFQRFDGARPVIEHVDWLAAEHQLSFHEARVLTMKYLETLMARGLVVIVVPALGSASGRDGPP